MRNCLFFRKPLPLLIDIYNVAYKKYKANIYNVAYKKYKANIEFYF